MKEEHYTRYTLLENERWPLVEALRRRLCYNANLSLTRQWTGLGTEAEYRGAIKAGLMEFVYETPPSREYGWLRLTEKGAKIVQAWIDQGIGVKDFKVDQYVLSEVTVKD
jgi:hypothetical protein